MRDKKKKRRGSSGVREKSGGRPGTNQGSGGQQTPSEWTEEKKKLGYLNETWSHLLATFSV